MPIAVSVTKESGNLENPGMFSPSTRTIHLAVDYCDEPAKRTSVQEVTYDMMQGGWAIAVGRPLGMPIVPATNPATYNQFELGYPANRTSAESGLVPFVVQSISGELDRSSNEVWRIRVVISLMIRNITPGDYEGRNHSAVSITSESRGVRAYRTNATLPTLTWNESDDRFTNTWITCGEDGIDGDPLDINGEPLTMPIEQTSIVLSFVIREPFYTSYSATVRTVDAMWGTWGRNPSSHVNKRNSTVLFGYPIGRLVVTNVSVTPIDMEFRRVDVTLVDDEWYHFDQMPWSTAGTIPELNVECDVPLTPPNLAVWHAKYVLWVTPIIDGFSWSQTDFPDDVWTFFTSAVTISTP